YKLGLPRHDHEDLRQNILLDLLLRLKAFDPVRGSLGAFAGKIAAHHASRLAYRIRRERALFAPLSASDPLPSQDDAPLSDRIFEIDGYSPTDSVGHAERRLAIDRALGSLRDVDLDVCAQLLDRTPTQISRGGTRPRATLYRQIREIRLRLMAAGLSG